MENQKKNIYKKTGVKHKGMQIEREALRRNKQQQINVLIYLCVYFSYIFLLYSACANSRMHVYVADTFRQHTFT